MARDVRVVHVITGLGVGGAETMLAKLIDAESRHGLHRTHEVISLTAEGPLAARIRGLGVTVTNLDMNIGGVRGVLSGMRQLARRLRTVRPDVVQCWMYHADLIGGLITRLVVPRATLLWSIRASFMPRPSPITTRAVIRACALLSWIVPDRVISCSADAARRHQRLGYRRSRIRVIPNGFDLNRFAPSTEARHTVRAALGLSDAARLVGCVARFDPQKDFPTLFRAFAMVAGADPSVHLVVVGRGATAANPEIEALCPPALRAQVHLLGVRDDVATLTAAFDVATLTSAYGEGFPNVLGEALACGVPCVATDVGDAREIVAEDGAVVPIGDAAGVADGIRRELSRSASDREQRGARARARVVREYDIDAVAQRYWQAQDGVDAAPVPVTALHGAH